MKIYRITHNTINDTWTCSVDVLRNGKPFTISTQSKRQYREKLTTLENRLFTKLQETIKEKGYTLIEPKPIPKGAKVINRTNDLKEFLSEN